MNSDSRNKVLVGLSGGLDSAAAAAILKSRGFAPVGLTVRHLEDSTSLEAARSAAEKLNIELIVLDRREEFRREVIDNFLECYRRGETPNPCVICNPAIKWSSLLSAADEMGARYVATGHYARTEEGKILRGADPAKDQSYFLYRLSPEAIRRTLFPLGEMSEDDVRAFARESGLSDLIKKRSSHEVCFFPRGELAAFLVENGGSGGPGNIVDCEGNILGSHDGWARFTPGQRRGHGVASSEGRLYVTGINPETAEVTLGPREETMSDFFSSGSCVFHGDWTIGEVRRVGVQIRHSGREIPGEVTRTGADTAEVTLSRLAFAPAPGQSAVFYREDFVVGGGIIEPYSRQSPM